MSCQSGTQRGEHRSLARSAVTRDPAGDEASPGPSAPRRGARPGSPRTPRRLKQIEAKRSAILDAGLRLFSRAGLHGTTVEQIAEEAGVSKTNLFYYFVSKEEIYVGALSRLLDEWLAPLRAMEADADPVAAIGDYIRRKILFSRSHPEASRLFCLEIVQGAPLLRRELETALKELVDAKSAMIHDWIAAGRLAPVDPHHLIFAIWATTQHYADFAVQIDALLGTGLEDEAFARAAAENVSRLLIEGIRCRPDS